jgi:hypothetical protein
MISLHFGGWAPHMFLTLYQQRYSPCATCSKISLNFGTATIYIHIYIYQDIPLSESEAIPNDRHVSSSSFHSTEAPNGLTQTAPKCMGVYLQNSALSMYIYIYSYYFMNMHTSMWQWCNIYIYIYIYIYMYIYIIYNVYKYVYYIYYISHVSKSCPSILQVASPSTSPPSRARPDRRAGGCWPPRCSTWGENLYGQPEIMGGPWGDRKTQKN